MSPSRSDVSKIEYQEPQNTDNTETPDENIGVDLSENADNTETPDENIGVDLSM